MIHKHKLFLAGTQQASSGDHAIISAIQIHDRKITVSLLCHCLSDIINVIVAPECDQILCLHKITDRHTLIDQTRCGISIIRCLNNEAALALCQLLDRKGYERTIADNNTFGIHFDRTKL